MGQMSWGLTPFVFWPVSPPVQFAWGLGDFSHLGPDQHLGSHRAQARCRLERVSGAGARGGG